MEKKRALGRGLEQLFNSENLDLNNFEQAIYEESTNEEIKDINLSELRPNPYQPRKNFNEEELIELTDSIKEIGVFQPIIVKKSIKGYEIIAGERRYRASLRAGMKTVPAIVRDLSDEQMMEIALLENLQRSNLSAIEEAFAYKSMIEKLDMTQEELSKKVGKSRSHITNMLGLLKLPEEIQELVISNSLSMGHARVLSKLSDKDKIISLALKVVKENLSVRQLEQVSAENNLEKNFKINRKVVDSSFKYVEDLLREKLDAKVKIKDKKLIISYTNTDDLNRILEIMNIKED